MKPTFKAMYIHRHDLAMRLTLKAISKGNHGGYHTIADIGRAELIRRHGGQCQENTNMAVAKLVPSCGRNGTNGKT